MIRWPSSCRSRDTDDSDHGPRSETAQTRSRSRDVVDWSPLSHPKLLVRLDRFVTCQHPAGLPYVYLRGSNTYRHRLRRRPGIAIGLQSRYIAGDRSSHSSRGDVSGSFRRPFTGRESAMPRIVTNVSIVTYCLLREMFLGFPRSAMIRRRWTAVSRDCRSGTSGGIDEMGRRDDAVRWRCSDVISATTRRFGE